MNGKFSLSVGVLVRSVRCGENFQCVAEKFLPFRVWVRRNPGLWILRFMRFKFLSFVPVLLDQAQQRFGLVTLGQLAQMFGKRQIAFVEFGQTACILRDIAHVSA